MNTILLIKTNYYWMSNMNTYVAAIVCSHLNKSSLIYNHLYIVETDTY